MFFQGVSSVLLLDKSGNDMLCSILFLSLIFDVLTDHFYWCPSCRQKTETLAPECFFPKFFPDFRILFFQQSAAGTFISIDKFTEFPYLFCSFWNWIIDNFSSIFYHHDQMIIHQVHWMCIVIYIFLFFAIHLPPVEEGEFLLYIMLKVYYRKKLFSIHPYIFATNPRYLRPSDDYQ